MNALPNLFCSDLDGTLIAPDSGAISPEALELLVLARSRMTFAYVTGRHLDLALDGMARAALPRPDYLACDVGTSLCRWEAGTWVRDEAYRAEIRRRLGAVEPGEIVSLVGDLAGLRPQESERQAEFKASFYWEVSEGAGLVRERVERAIEDLGVTVTLILSTDPERRLGLLDILPEGASKASALEHLRRNLGLSPDQVFFAGDSGNDVEALLSGVPGVLVGNASEDVRREVRRGAASRGLERRIIFASGSYADGVVEGLRGHGFL